MLVAGLSGPVGPASAGWLEDRGLIDPEDGMLDASDYLSGAHGFLPVPFFITEPAIGTGLGLAVAYFHPSGEDADREAHPHEGPPSITLGVGGYTDNDTWLLGGVHQGIWKDDHLRYLGAVAALSVNARYYGLNSGRDSAGNEFSQGVRFKTEGGLVYQQLNFRLAESDWWAGGHFIYSDVDNEFRVNIGQDPPIELPGIRFNTTNSGLGVSIGYDGRNTTFTPTAGTRLELKYTRYDQGIGGDFNYDMYETAVFHYLPTAEHSSLGLRLEFDALRGDAPFFAYPFISLRGIPALRYQGDDVVTGELEYLWGFTSRWSLALFGGVGKAFADESAGSSDETAWAYGTGIRYRLAKKFGLQGGVDVARGPEDTAFYITMGSAWR